MRFLAPVLLLLLLGCKSTSASHLTRAATPQLDPGWKTFIKAKAGFSVGLPGSFRDLDLSQFEEKGASPGKLPGIFGSGNSGRDTDVLSAMSMEGGTMAMAAFVAEKKANNLDLKTEMKEVTEAVEHMGEWKVTDQSDVDLPIGKSSRIVSELSRGLVKARITVYVMVDGPVRYTALFMGIGEEQLLTKRIMRTFRVTKLAKT